ncbi:MAG: DUF1273 family protein [Clostridia bacterium]|nr:DUF1273 family protein [Clostridia bacterium]
MEKHKTCSFFGHRKIDTNNNLKQSVKDCIEDLIINRNVQTFLFGSRSDFNDLCHLVVSELKEKYSNIKRMCYTCKSEGCTLEIDRQEREKIYSRFLNKEVHLLGFEEEFEHETKYVAGRASYIERNQAMINDSDFCVFYYDENYVPLTKTNSGTKIAYEYAVREKKNVINLFK